MKTSKITALLLFCCTAIVFSSFTSSSIIKSNDKDKEDEIELFGSLGNGKARSLSYPFMVTKSSSFITVSYLNNLSNIHVEITDEYGQQVYYITVNPIAGNHLLINTFGWDNGNYQIVFSNNNGGSIYGEFDI
jgi:hypothetical protein